MEVNVPPSVCIIVVNHSYVSNKPNMNLYTLMTETHCRVWVTDGANGGYFFTLPQLRLEEGGEALVLVLAIPLTFFLVRLLTFSCLKI